MTESQKIDVIYNKMNDLTIVIAEHKVRNEQIRKELDLHASDIKTLEAYRNTQIGKVSILSLLFGTFGAAIFALIKHFTHSS